MDLSVYVFKPKERIVYYPAVDFFPLPPRFVMLRDHFNELLPFVEIQLRGIHAFNDQHGTWMTDRAIELAVIEIRSMLRWKMMDLIQTERVIRLLGEDKVGKDYDDNSGSWKLLDALDQEATDDLLAHCDAFSSSLEDWGEYAECPNESDLSPKISKLITVFTEAQAANANFTAIVFVKERLIAVLLSLVLRKKADSLGIKAGYIIGHASQSKSFGNTLGMGVKMQKQVVSDFRSSRLNVLVSTQVAEEGLDIQPCNMVVRFDVPGTLISYIQSKGRARHKHSEFLVLAEEGDTTVAKRLLELQNEEQEMRSMLHDGAEIDFGLESRIAEPKVDDDVLQTRVFRIDESGALLTVNNAIAVLNDYCCTLPSDTIFQPRPQYSFTHEGGMVCKISLPRSIRVDCQELVGPPCTSKQLAKRQAAFQMAIRLYKLGELDGYLLSSHRKEKGKNLMQVKSGRSLLHRSYTIALPTLFTGTFENVPAMWVNVIRIKPQGEQNWKTLTIGFLTFRKIHKDLTKPFFADILEEQYQLMLVPLSTPLELTNDIVVGMKQFHTQFFKSLVRSQFNEETGWATYCVPFVHGESGTLCANFATRPTDLIDWDALRRCVHGETSVIDPRNPDDLKNILLYDPYQWKRTYIPLEIHFDMNPNAEVLENGQLMTLRQCYQKIFKCKEEIDDDQPIISATAIGYPHCTYRKPKEFPTVLLIPGVCMVHPIRKPHLEDGLYMPIVMQYIYHRMLAEDIKSCVPFAEKSQRLTVSLDHLNMALTTRNAGLEYDYQRLETLGDSFLKLVLSTHLFVKHPTSHEGFLTVSRVSLENNEFLRTKANEMGIEGYVHSIPFDRRTWVPPTDSSIVHSQILADKCVADIMESILGACVLTNFDDAPYAARQLIGLELETSWQRYLDDWAANMPPGMGLRLEYMMKRSIEEVEETIGYEFREKQYLAEALTHASCFNQGRSMERLEFLGDAVLGYIVTHFIYSLEPELDPGRMTGLKGMLVSNQFLACVSLGLDLPRHLVHGHNGILSMIHKWQELFNTEMAKSDVNGEQTHQNLLFWSHMETAPKVLGDMYEALLGAIFLDSGFDVGVIWGVMERTFFNAWWPRYIPMLQTDGFLHIHPVHELFELVYHGQCEGLELKLILIMQGIDIGRWAVRSHLCVSRFTAVMLYWTYSERSEKGGGATGA